jgi:hypothetical protein
MGCIKFSDFQFVSGEDKVKLPAVFPIDNRQ